MTDFFATGHYFCIGHLVQITGLTDRTIRSHISTGILQGKKINGVWHFSPEQVDAFLRHPSVRPSILAKQHAIVYDFLLEDKKKTHEACIIMDLPKANEKAAAEFFCYQISNGPFHDLRFFFDSIGQTPRIILRGKTRDAMKLAAAYYDHFPDDSAK